MSINAGKKSKKGRPRVDSDEVSARFQRSALNEISAWISSRPDPKPSRAEALRQLVEIGLKATKTFEANGEP